MPQEVIVTCAVTGGHNNFAKHPDYPITPAQIAAACQEARDAGAAIAHIHVRDPESGAHSGDSALFAEVVDRIRQSGNDILINLTTGWGGRYVPSKEDPARGGPGTNLTHPQRRLQHVIEQKPDICSLDVGTFTFGEQIFVGFPEHIREMAVTIKELGVKPEIECFEPGHIVFSKSLLEAGLLEEPPLFQLCLGIPNASPALPEVMQLMRDLLPAESRWSAFGIGRWQFPMVAASVTLGGNVRVGLEDNLYLGRGEFATNGTLVERAVSIIEDLGAEAVAPSRAAEILDLPSRRGKRPAAAAQAG